MRSYPASTSLIYRHLQLGGAVLLCLIAMACATAGSDQSGSSGVGGAGGADGSGGIGLFSGELADRVPQSCEAAQSFGGYLGCVFWPTVTSNKDVGDNFAFAVVVTNPTQNDATISVERNGTTVSQAFISAGQLGTLQLPWVSELKDSSESGSKELRSLLLADGAYKLTSTVPVSVHQFNPLEFQNPNDANDYAHSNDASLLLPQTTLRTDYYALAYPTFHTGPEVGGEIIEWLNIPGFVSVTATEDGTTVDITASAHVRAGPGVSALTPGAQGSYAMDAGDVLMLMSGALPEGDSSVPGKPCETGMIGAVSIRYCPSPPEYDLSGTRVVADKPVSVLSGHNCTYVPFNRYACDHLEEAMMPVETLGDSVLVSAPAAVSSIGGSNNTPDNMFVRVLSTTDDNTVSFAPAIAEPVTLAAGGWIELGPVQQDLYITADDKILVAQYLVGENFSGTPAGAGDPAQSVAIPSAQYREAYAVLAPESFTHNFINVIAPTGASIILDGAALDASSFTPIASSGFGVLRQAISGGAHAIHSETPFGVVVYGYAKYASYMYPGGLDLETIVIPPK